MIGLLIDDDNDLVVEVVRNVDGLIIGGLCVGDDLKQRQKMILEANKGDFKCCPAIGVCLVSFINDNSPVSMYREIRSQFAIDGIVIRSINLKGGNLNLVADEN